MVLLARGRLGVFAAGPARTIRAHLERNERDQQGALGHVDSAVVLGFLALSFPALPSRSAADGPS